MWQWVPAAPVKVGRHRRAEPVPEFEDRPVPDIGSTGWWLWRGARLIAERHHEHPHRPGMCAFCPPDAAWPCAALDLAYRAEEMSQRLGPGPKRAGCRYPCCAAEPAGAGTR